MPLHHMPFNQNMNLINLILTLKKMDSCGIDVVARSRTIPEPTSSFCLYVGCSLWPNRNLHGAIKGSHSVGARSNQWGAWEQLHTAIAQQKHRGATGDANHIRAEGPPETVDVLSSTNTLYCAPCRQFVRVMLCEERLQPNAASIN